MFFIYFYQNFFALKLFNADKYDGYLIDFQTNFQAAKKYYQV